MKHHMKSYKVTEEQLEHLIESMLEWMLKDTSLTVPQFLLEHSLSYSMINFCRYCSCRFDDTFQLMLSSLHHRWLKFAWEEKDLSPH